MKAPPAAAGYSGTPLPRKLGLKAGQSVAFVGLPGGLADLARADAFADVDLVAAADELGPTCAHDLIHAFYVRTHDLEAALGCLRAAIRPNGMIWISWPK